MRTIARFAADDKEVHVGELQLAIFPNTLPDVAEQSGSEATAVVQAGVGGVEEHFAGKDSASRSFAAADEFWKAEVHMRALSVASLNPWVGASVTQFRMPFLSALRI